MTPDLTQARLHCEAAYPNEGVCAYLRTGSTWRFVPLENVSEAPHTSFVIDPLAWMKLERANQAICLVHSHVDGPAELSRRDLDTFTVDGRPLLPNLVLVVVEVRDRRAVSVGEWSFRNGAWEPIAPAL